MKNMKKETVAKAPKMPAKAGAKKAPMKSLEDVKKFTAKKYGKK